MDIRKVFSVMQSMASVGRYSDTRLANRESVLEHTGFVVLICYILGCELNTIANAARIDMGLLLMRAAAHDLEEIMTGDILRPTKYASRESLDFFDGVKRRAIGKVTMQMALCKEVRELIESHHEHAKANDVPGCVLEMADKIAVVYKLWDEVLLRHNHSMIKQAVHVQGFLHALTRRINAIVTNKEQRYYLLSLLDNMMTIVKVVIGRNNPIYGTIEE